MGEEHVKKHDLSSLRVLGSVGEPINPEAWHWYNDFAGKNQCAIVDTYWMTETGSISIAPLPGAISTKPGSATFPFFGMDVDIIDPQSGQILEGNDVEGVLVAKKPWPSLARTVYRDHKRYLETYMKPYPGYFFFGDGAARDYDGYMWIKGRVDDVINVSGHRLSTAEVESALILHKGVAETAVVGCADDLTGQAVYAFVTMKPEFDLKSTKEADLSKELAIQVRKVIGPFAAPKKIVSLFRSPSERDYHSDDYCSTSSLISQRPDQERLCVESSERLLLARVTNWETFLPLLTPKLSMKVSLQFFLMNLIER